ncbi:MAG: glycoside hydrolase, partial [Ruminococcaceae bacterium]|nr:glycoside hydrolase [Oscillospiraceae bacterium]
IADRQGTVEQITYDSVNYAGSGDAIQKTAYVYLPYGYDESDTQTKYDILYLMHGWGGSAGEYFTVGNGMIKNMLDRMIENGEIVPMIVVSATFYNDGSSKDFGSSVRELRQFHQDFANHLMAAVEGRYHSYAKSTSAEDLAASRDHRAFGGFSLGSVTTWHQFCYNYDYICYFLPMSGACWYYGGYGDYYPEETCDFFEELIEENSLNERGYYIYAATGTNDAVRDQVDILMDEMLERNDVFSPDHVVYYMKEGGVHDFNAIIEYMYNALPLFFRG